MAILTLAVLENSSYYMSSQKWSFCVEFAKSDSDSIHHFVNRDENLHTEGDRGSASKT